MSTATVIGSSLEQLGRQLVLRNVAARGDLIGKTRGSLGLTVRCSMVKLLGSYPATGLQLWQTGSLSNRKGYDSLFN